MNAPAPFPLSFCLNARDASTWPAARKTLDSAMPALKALVAPDRPFPLSLHLGEKAAAQLLRDGHLDAFADWLRRTGFFLAAVNAFPMGHFHARSVKANAYRPDWRKERRLRHTQTVASILALLVPVGGTATLTTVPGGWLPDWRSCNDPALALDQLRRAAEFCRDLEARYARRIRIAVEPEPGCAWELLDPFVEAVGPEVGWCLDACHAAVDFRPLDQLDWSRIHRVQLSAAIECDNVPAARDALRPFVERRYLHQTRAAIDGEIVGEWPDLAPALRALPKLPERAVVRTHYHVPLTWEGAGPLRSTRANMTPAFFAQARRVFCEVETYTYSVLPPALRAAPFERAVAAELRWAADRLRDAI